MQSSNDANLFWSPLALTSLCPIRSSSASLLARSRRIAFPIFPISFGCALPCAIQINALSSIRGIDLLFHQLLILFHHASSLFSQCKSKCLQSASLNALEAEIFVGMIQLPADLIIRNHHGD